MLCSGSLATGPLSFVDKTPYGSHQMRHGNVNTPFPENLRDPVDAEPAPVRFQDLFLKLSQGVDFGLLSITAAFRAARDFEKILGSGFEMIRISQCESPRVCGFMIKKGQIGDQIDDHNRGELRYHPEGSRAGDLDQNRDPNPHGFSGRYDRAVRIPPSRGRLADILEVELESFGLRFGSGSRRTR